MAPADKAANNVIFMCKKWYIKELKNSGFMIIIIQMVLTGCATDLLMMLWMNISFVYSIWV